MLYVDKKYGFYRVNHNQQIIETSSKIEALEIAQRVNGWVSYHFNDETYSSYDWQKEINIDIDEFYKRRAEQLRTKYDRLVLLYSGGLDSDNILKTFVKNNIHLDAIVSFYYSVDQDNTESDINQEWKLQTWPRLQQVLSLIPHTEFIRFDLTKIIFHTFDELYDDWLYRVHGPIGPNSLGRSYIKKFLSKKYNDYDTAIIYGHEKPRLRYKDKKFIFNFLDVANADKPVVDNNGVEYFYWSPDCPELVIKQAQIVKSYWENNISLIDSHPKNIKKSNIGTVLDHDYIPVQRLVYPQCDNSLYFTWRPRSKVFGRRDEWIYKSNSDLQKKIMKIYGSLKNLPAEWFNDDTHDMGLKGYLSKDYVL